MHELAIATAIVDLSAEAGEGARVTRVVVAIGPEAAVVPEALRFCFELAAADTPVAGATLEIESIEGAGLRLQRIEVI
jgi:hydrogenase nickel incorporation protein HypA/HybF